MPDESTSFSLNLNSLASVILRAVGSPSDVLRELVQNAADAITMRLALDPNSSIGETTIRLYADTSAQTLSIADPGIGMTLDELQDQLSSTGASVKGSHEALSSQARIVGSFGVGFLLSFAVADLTEVRTRSASKSEESSLRLLLDARGEYLLSAESVGLDVGTKVLLHLRPEARELADAEFLENCIRTDLVEVPYPIELQGRIVHPGASQKPRLSERDINLEVGRTLRAAGFEVQAEPAFGGLRPDYIVRGPRGQLVVIETKNWTESPARLRQAAHQAQRYKEVTGADAALVVLAGGTMASGIDGVVSLGGLVEAVTQALEKEPKGSLSSRELIAPLDKIIFAAMPFGEEYDDVYFVAMVHAAQQIGATCIRVDKEDFAGDIVKRIQDDIMASAAIIVDLSESKPNVLYEAGFAHALGKPAVHICWTPLDALPFDVRNWKTIPYGRGRTHMLREALTARLRSLI